MKAKLSYEKFLNILFVFLMETKQGVIILDAYGEKRPIVYANNGFLKLTGFDKEEILDKQLDFLFGSETSEDKISALNSLIQNTENGEVSALIYKKNGGKIWALFSISPIRDLKGKNTHLLLTMNDVTAQRNLTKRKAEFDSMKATLETVNDIVFNYMNYLLEFRTELEEHFEQENNIEGISKLEIFDFELKNVLNKLMAMNELKEYKNKHITTDLKLLFNENSDRDLDE